MLLGGGAGGGPWAPPSTPPTWAPWLPEAQPPPPALSRAATTSPSRRATAPRRVAPSTPPRQGVRPSTGRGLSFEQNGGLSCPLPAEFRQLLPEQVPSWALHLAAWSVGAWAPDPGRPVGWWLPWQPRAGVEEGAPRLCRKVLLEVRATMVPGEQAEPGACTAGLLAAPLGQMQRWSLGAWPCPGTAGWRWGVAREACSHLRSPALGEVLAGKGSLQGYPRLAPLPTLRPWFSCPAGPFFCCLSAGQHVPHC